MFTTSVAALLAVAIAAVRAAAATPIALQLAKAAVSGVAGALVKESVKRRRSAEARRQTHR